MKDQSPKTDTNLIEKIVSKNSGSLARLSELERDLKFVTGKSDKAEILFEISRIKKEEDPLKIIRDENKKNYEHGMSFTPEQNRVLNSFQADTIIGFISSKISKEENNLTQTLAGLNIKVPYFTDVLNEDGNIDDVAKKIRMGKFVSWYRENRKDFSRSGYYSNYQELDSFVLSYEKAFGIDAGLLEVANLEREREEKDEDVKNKVILLSQGMKKLFAGSRPAILNSGSLVIKQNDLDKVMGLVRDLESRLDLRD